MSILYKKMSNHYIICGFDTISRGICYKLKEENIPFIIIDSNEKSYEYATLRNYELINDEPANDATLIAAGIEEAVGLVTCSSNDSDNLYITLSARELKPDIHIISCSSDPSKEARMKRAGADIVVYPEYLGGREIAKLICRDSSNIHIENEENTTISLEGYSLKVYKHFDIDPIFISEVLSQTESFTAIAHIHDGITDYDFKMNAKVNQNDAVILALDDKHKKDEGSSGKSYMSWSSTYSVGIVSIDKEHKKIIDMINRIISCSINNQKNVLSSILDELFDYAVEHFKHEEILFRKYSYPDIEEHIKIHKDILNKIRELNNNSAQMHTLTLFTFLKSWIKHHFGIVDQKYSKFLIDKGVK